MSCIDPPHVHATKKAAPMQAPVDVVVFTDRHHMYSMLNLAGNHIRLLLAAHTQRQVCLQS